MTEIVVRVLIADDHPIVRSGLRSLLESVPGHEVVGESADGEAAVRDTVLTLPDVVLMDVNMPGIDGLEATRRIREAAPDVAVLVLTMSDDDETVLAAMRAGARGYLLKGANQHEIGRAIRSVLAGEAIFGAGVAARVLDHLSGPAARNGSEPFPQLTHRERQILDLVAAGHRNRVIADRLFLSPKTVANQVSLIFAKLAVADRPGAIVLARDAGLGRSG